MQEARHAVLLFTKPPLPGLVKTRLTTLKDGIFTPEQAAGLYHCMLFDVCEVCCAACEQLEAAHPGESFDFFISTTPGENLTVMRELFEKSGEWPRKIHFIYDTGASFDEHYNDAFSQVFDAGYDTVLSMGVDMPALTVSLVRDGFEGLRAFLASGKPGLVISPDQMMGVSIVGWTRDTPMTHDGVYYNQDGLTVLPAYIAKCDAAGLPVTYLEAVPDVDTMLDLYHASTVVQALCYCARFDERMVAPERTRKALDELGCGDLRIPPNDLHDPREDIDD